MRRIKSRGGLATRRALGYASPAVVGGAAPTHIRPRLIAVILLAATAAFAPLSASATANRAVPDRYRLRSLAPSRGLTTRPAQPRLRARANGPAPLPLGTGVSPNFPVSPPGQDAFETSAVTTDPTFHRTVYASAEDQSTGGIAGLTSRDAGGNWSSSWLPYPATGPREFLALPSAEFDSASNLYESYLGAAVNGASVATQLLVARSPDRGNTWASPVAVETSNIPDSAQLAVDTTGGAFKNRAYVAYDTNPVTSPGTYSQPLVLAYSDDGVAWTKTQVGDTGSAHEAHPTIGPNGEVYLVWTDYCGGYSSNPSGADCLSLSRTVMLDVARSDSGGDFFQLNVGMNTGRVADLGTTFPYAMPNYSNDCGGSGPTPIEPSPSVAVDRSGGPYQGTVYAAFTGRYRGSSHAYLVRSTDKGANWSPYVQLDSGNPNTDAWGPAVAVDQSNGAVTVAWYDRRDDSMNKLYRVYYTQSIDGGQTFLPNEIAVSDRKADPTVDCLATGAYMQMRAADGIAQPFWTDTDSGAIVSAFISERSNYLAPTQVFGSAAATTVAQAGDGVAGVVTGDFNGDGKLDLAVPSTKNGSGVVSVYLGNGDGAFTAGQTITLEALPITSRAWAIVTADFDGDGKKDLAVAGQRCDSTSCPDVVWFLRGIGDGTFQTPTYKAAGGIGFAYAMAVGKFTSSSLPDLILDNGDQASLSFMRNTSTSGSISFSDPIMLSVVGRNPVVADFNRDGKQDIAFTYLNGTTGNAYIGVLRGNGDGTFVTPPLTTTAVNPYALATADLNLDGKPDLVASAGGNLMIMLGNGDGSFNTQPLQPLGGFVVLLARDVTGDGVPDILMDCGNVWRAICTLVGKGDGTFGSPITSTYNNTGYATDGIAVGDLNGDGKPDLAVTQGGRQSFNVLLHIGDQLNGTSRVSFGAVSMGQAVNRTAVLTNGGTSELPVSFLSTESPDFSVVNDPCSGATLAAGASCTVTIRFTPGTLQSETANLIAFGDKRGTMVTIPLDGMGMRGSAPVTGPTYQFRPRTSSGSGTQPARAAAAKATSAPTLPSPASGGGKFHAFGLKWRIR